VKNPGSGNTVHHTGLPWICSLLRTL